MLDWLTKYLCSIKYFLRKVLRVKDTTAYSIREIIVREITNSLALQHNSEYNAESRIHEYRKAIKRCRSLLWVFRLCIDEFEYTQLDEKFSKVGGDMAERRDATVNLRTFLHLRQTHSTFLPENINQQITNDLTENLKIAYAICNNNPIKTEASLLDNLKTVWTDLNSINIKPCSHSDFLNTIEKSHYKAAQLYFDSRNTLETEIIHKWRKSTKRLLLQLKFTPSIDQILMDPIITKLDKITDSLGRDHDLAVLENTLKENIRLSRENFQKIHLIVIKERAKLQKEAFWLGEEVFSKEHVRNFRLKSFV